MLRTLLVLGRVSNLPTVWSNCMAALWLSGNGSWTLQDWKTLAWVCLGTSLLYVGGMYLNDAWDVEFDRQHRAERPIPSGRISAAAVWKWGVGWLVGGSLILIVLRPASLIWVLLLVAAILIYDALHKLVQFSPFLMAACRVLLVLLAASYGWNGITGLAIWSALVLGCYIVGLSYLARRESTWQWLDHWPLLPLAAPLVLAYLVNGGEYRTAFYALGLLTTFWIIRSIGPLWGSARPNIGRAVSGLLAGICLIDLLSVADIPRPMGAIFLVLFGLSLLFQRSVPAT